MKPRSGSASLAETSWFTWSAWVKWCPAWGEVSWIAFTGPSRLPEASPTGTHPFRLRAMAFILPCASDKSGAAFSAAEGKRGQGIISCRAAFFWMSADSGRSNLRHR